MSAVTRLDRYQRRHKWLGLPIAVIYKFFDDRGTYMAALVSYYAFVSLFPLLLLFYSVLGFFLQGHAGVRMDIERSVLNDFPVIGARLTKSIAEFRGSGVALAIGIVGTLYGGLGAMQAAQAGFNTIYGVPRNRQPNPLKSRLRSLGLLGLLGSGVLLSTAIAVILSTANGISKEIGPAVQTGGYALSYIVNVGLFSAGFQLLTALELRFRQVMAGGMVAAAAWMLVQGFGSSYIGHVFKHSDHLYGVFAVVLATLAWLYLQSLILMISAEINVVLQNRLWPRSLLTPFTDNVILTSADRRVYELYAKTQRFKGFETVTAEFRPAAPDAAGDGEESQQRPEEDQMPVSDPSPPEGSGRQPEPSVDP